MGSYFLALHHKEIGRYWMRESSGMEESIFKLKAAAALLQNMVSTEEEVRYNARFDQWHPFAQNKMYRSFSTGFSPGPNPFVK